MRKLLRLVLSLLLFVLVVLLLTRTWAFESKQFWLKKTEAPGALSDKAFDRLLSSLRLPTPTTVSFERLAQLQARQFPNLWKQLEQSRFNQGSYLYKWEGRDPALKPLLLVFNVQQKAARRPLRNDSLWHESQGRIEAQACLEVLNQLLDQKGPIPERSVYLAFLHEEEQAQLLAAVLREENLRFDAIFIAESGFLPYSQLPKQRGALALIARAAQGRAELRIPIKKAEADKVDSLKQLLQAQSLDWCFDQHYQAFMDYLAPELALEYRLLFANANLLGYWGRSVLRQAPIWPKLYTGGYDSQLTDSSLLLRLHWPAAKQGFALSQELSTSLAEAGFALQELDIHYLPSRSNTSNGYAFGLLEYSIKSNWPEMYSLPVASPDAPLSQPFISSFEQAYAFSPLPLEEDGQRQGIIDAPLYEKCQHFYYRLLQRALF